MGDIAAVTNSILIDDNNYDILQKDDFKYLGSATKITVNDLETSITGTTDTNKEILKNRIEEIIYKIKHSVSNRERALLKVMFLNIGKN